MSTQGNLFGSIAGLFTGPDKLKSVYKDDSLQGIIDAQGNEVTAQNRRNADTLASYTAAMNRLRPLIQNTGTEDVGFLGNLAKNNSTYDPLATYGSIRSGNLAAFNDEAGKIADRGSLADKLALAASGYGGRGPSSYNTILTNDRVSKNLAPVLNTIFGNLGNDTGTISNARSQNLRDTLAAIAGREQIPQSLLGWEASPIQVGNAALAGTTNALGGVTNASNQNFGGFNLEVSPWKTFATALGDQFNSDLGTFTSMGGMGMLGGMAGMGGGGGSGGGGSGGGGGGNLLSGLLGAAGGGGGSGGGGWGDLLKAFMGSGGGGGGRRSTAWEDQPSWARESGGLSWDSTPVPDGWDY